MVTNVARKIVAQDVSYASDYRSDDVANLNCTSGHSPIPNAPYPISNRQFPIANAQEQMPGIHFRLREAIASLCARGLGCARAWACQGVYDADVGRMSAGNIDAGES